MLKENKEKEEGQRNECCTRGAKIYPGEPLLPAALRLAVGLLAAEDREGGAEGLCAGARLLQHAVNVAARGPELLDGTVACAPDRAALDEQPR